MLIDVKEKIDDVKILELINYSVFSDSRNLEQTLHDYKSNRYLELKALEDDGEWIGIIGFKIRNEIIEIKHIAVHPGCRGLGYGRGLILELIALKVPKEIFAETDEEAVDFYRSVGFSISSLGEHYPGIERFRCSYNIDEND